MMKSWYVLKFGGTSIATLEGWNQVAIIIASRMKQANLLIINSALSGVSDLLEKMFFSVSYEERKHYFSEIINIHTELGRCMDLNASVILEAEFTVLKHFCQAPQPGYLVQAHIMAQGELMSTRLGEAFLARKLSPDSDLSEKDRPTQWLDIRDYLICDPCKFEHNSSSFLNAKINHLRDSRLESLLTSQIVISQGFIAASPDNDTVLLGRGGSDVSAAILAARIGALQLEIWTDTPGVFSADPGEIPEARLLKNLSYEEAQEIASTGAKVLHPGTLPPIQAYNIPLLIRSTFLPELEGTRIAAIQNEPGQLKAVSVRKNITLIAMETINMWQQAGFLSSIFERFKKQNISVDLISTSQSSVTVTLDPESNALSPGCIETLLNSLKEICQITLIENCASVSLVGHHIDTALQSFGTAFEFLTGHQVYMLALASNNLNLTLVVDGHQADYLAKMFHQMLISNLRFDQSFGRTWSELILCSTQNKSNLQSEQQKLWWINDRDQLLQLADQTPLYVYSQKALEAVARRLKGMNFVDRLYYAVKANSHPDVLRVIFEQGFGFECVSPGEIRLILNLFPDLSGERILFTPNFVSQEEYKFAFSRGVIVTLDSSYPLVNWPELFQNQKIFIRCDPGIGIGHHSYVRTGGAYSKFGIPETEFGHLRSLLLANNVSVYGLHSHCGSGVIDPNHWYTAAKYLADQAKFFPAAKVLNLGGGLAVAYEENDQDLNIEHVNSMLGKFKDEHPTLSIWLEPGRYMTAEAGILLASVTQLKEKKGRTYLGINTGMNSLLRPALYGAFHQIVNLSRINQVSDTFYTVVGPICETADQIGTDRLLPQGKAGDILLISHAGAYCHVMSSTYNLRDPAQEYFIQ